MTHLTFRSSRPCNFVDPRPHRDPSLRYMKYGKIQPMDYRANALTRTRLSSFGSNLLRSFAASRFNPFRRRTH